MILFCGNMKALTNDLEKKRGCMNVKKVMELFHGNWANVIDHRL